MDTLQLASQWPTHVIVEELMNLKSEEILDFHLILFVDFKTFLIKTAMFYFDELHYLLAVTPLGIY